MDDQEKRKIEIINITNQLYLRNILFAFAMLIFIALAVCFIYMILSKEYDWKLIGVVGGADSVFALVILRITRSLFKVDK